MRSVRMLIATGALAAATLAAAADPKVYQKDRRYYVSIDEAPGFAIPLEAHGEAPRISEHHTVPSASQLRVIVYGAGEIGTASVYRLTRAVVIDAKEKRVLGDAPWRYEAIDSAPALVQPQWVWETRRLSVTDEAFGEDLRLRW